MSMPVVFIKVSPSLHQRIVDSEGELLRQMSDMRPVEGFSHGSDVFEELDYRDISNWVSDNANPFSRLFNDGKVLVDGFEWPSGPPGYFSPEEAREILQEFQGYDVAEAYSDFGVEDEEYEDDDPHWHFTSVIEFFQRAVSEGKGVIVGVA